MIGGQDLTLLLAYILQLKYVFSRDRRRRTELLMSDGRHLSCSNYVGRDKTLEDVQGFFVTIQSESRAVKADT